MNLVAGVRSLIFPLYTIIVSIFFSIIPISPLYNPNIIVLPRVLLKAGLGEWFAYFGVFVCWGTIGDNGKENGNYYIIIGYTLG